ncbi:unnamed protein product [marine sediment metagenome]|uniref:Uncharacterized protein n=2 Tax=marine sediment metagenome TaxID=412755 RepID=X1QKJ4_9ZZZZ
MVSTKQKVSRALMHVPVGIFNVFCLYVEIVFGILFFTGFFIYELQEDYRLKDGAYLDIYGWLIGFGLGVALLFMLQMFNLVE